MATLVAVVAITGSFIYTYDTKAATCEPTAARKTEIATWLALFADYEAKYNALAKAIARGGSAPMDYISPNVSPDITQGPTIRDSLDGKEILRKDLYFGYDEVAKARQACRDLNCDSYTLPSTHTAAQSALNAFKAAAKALPLFYGPSGMMLVGPGYNYTGRFMSNNDADALRKELVPKTCDDDSDRPTTTTPTTPATPATPPTTTTGTYSLEYVTTLLKQISDLTNENASLKAQLAARSSSTAGASQTSGSVSGSSRPTTGATSACPAFTRNISQGATGFDVSGLQSFLAQDPAVYPEGLVTGYFGPATERAVGRWQKQKGVATEGNPGFGTVGPLTRSAILTSCY